MSNKPVRQLLEGLSDALEATFAEHGMSARVVGGQNAIVFDMVVMGHPDGLSHVAEEIVRRLGRYGASECAIRHSGDKRLEIVIK